MTQATEALGCLTTSTLVFNAVNHSTAARAFSAASPLRQPLDGLDLTHHGYVSGRSTTRKRAPNRRFQIRSPAISWWRRGRIELPEKAPHATAKAAPDSKSSRDSRPAPLKTASADCQL